MPTTTAIENELRRINSSRNRYAYLIQFALLGFSVWYQTRFQSPLGPFILALGASGCVLRFFASEIIGEEKVASKVFLWLGFILLSTAWVFHIDETLRLYGPSGETLPVLRVMIGILILSNHAFLAADIRSHFAFLFPLTVGLILEVFIFERVESSNPLVAFFVVAFLSTLGLYQQNRQLREFISARLDADRDRNRMKRIIDGVPGFVGIIDAEGTYIHGNKNILAFYPNLVGTKVGELSQGSDYSVFVREFLRSDKEWDTKETHADIQGEHHYLMTTCGRLEDGEVMIINIPITELVKARKELREQEAMAQYSSKLVSIGKMAAGVAHEVNNPLAIIAGSANIINDLVQEDDIDRKNLKLFSEKIVQTSERIAQIVRSLRSLSRGGEKDPFSPLSLQALIRTVMDLANNSFNQHKVQIILPENKKDLTVMGREVQLGQVLLNLLSNSIDAVRDMDEKWIMIDYGHSDGHVWLEVVDSGKGISPEIAEKIMDPFFTTKFKDGTGLGLPISLKILEEHGGRLTYEASRPNTTFRMRFPTPKV